MFNIADDRHTHLSICINFLAIKIYNNIRKHTCDIWL